ncbi:MAG: twin-arginine translocation signal domain-containing protein [Rhodospirillales bacterium]
MSRTRRSFLQTTAALGAGLSGAPSWSSAQDRRGARNPIVAIPDSEIKVPKVKFGKYELSRFMIGSNPFNGTAHFNRTLDGVMREWYRSGKVVEVMRRCEGFGINCYNYVHAPRLYAAWEHYAAEGGKMHIVAQAYQDDPTEMVKALKPAGVWVIGERVDTAWRRNQLNTIRDYCKKLRDLGVEMVGVGSHIPEVLALVEEQGWDVDFYAGCVYNRRRTQEELQRLMSGELPEQIQEVYLQGDPPRMYRVFRQTKKPCVAFKILAAGRVSNVEAAFKLAFESIKPIDLVCVGLFPYLKDEVKENAYWTMRYGSTS